MSTMSRVFAIAVVLFVAGTAAAQITPSAPPSCEKVSQLALSKAKIVSAQTVEAGTFAPPAAMSPWLTGSPDLYKALGAFCRVLVEAMPSADSSIKIEVWLPEEAWNGRFRGQGNGGFAGEID